MSACLEDGYARRVKENCVSFALACTISSSFVHIVALMVDEHASGGNERQQAAEQYRDLRTMYIIVLG
jgi:hypothetical protein